MAEPAVRLRPVRDDAADYAALAAVGTAAWPAEPMSAGFLRRREAELPAGHLLAHLLAEPGDGGAVGMATYGHIPDYFHPRRFFCDLRVHPRARRRGVGDALYRAVVEALRPRRPEYLVCPVAEDHAEGVGFLTRRGFRPAERTARSELDPATFDPAPFSALGVRLAREGVEIRTLAQLRKSDPLWREKLYELYCSVQRDVPTVEEHNPVPFDSWVRSYGDNPDLLEEGQLIALDGAEYVGLTQLWASEATDRHLYTGLTGVRRSHRRRGIATALKVRATAYAATLESTAGRPPRIRTGNEESNPMLELNRRLGFVALPALVYYRRDAGRGATA